MPATLDIDLLRSFAAIAQTSTLGRAAQRVGRTQSALSMQMRRLEDLTGQTLLHRTGRGVRLTAQGERLLAHAQRILRSHDEALADLSGSGLTGTLSLGCPDDYAAAFLPPLLQGFARLHPLALVEVVCASTPRLRERLAAGTLDVALVSVLDTEADMPETKLDVIRHESLVWVGSPGADPANWDPLPLALSDPDALDYQAVLAGLLRQGRRFRVAYASSSLTGLVAVARAGLAMAVLTQHAVPADLQVFVPAEAGLPTLPGLGIAAAFAASARPTSLAMAFAEYARMALPSV
jgi:DNA-binding transcriptional LysR family regulator